MDRDSLVLAALSPARGATHTPVQVQKLLFLIDKNVPRQVGGPYFNFQPYDYGPFDQAIYGVLQSLASKRLVVINEETGRRWKEYLLTSEGQRIGENAFKELDKKTATYIAKLSEFVRGVSFAQLVSAVYKAYPEMKVNSVFKELKI